jgi:undecaprenyl-phosphate galactose phosphotransferase/putative colanic acid biosynthesis UDP-glucose lipid carrier transferase
MSDLSSGPVNGFWAWLKPRLSYDGLGPLVGLCDSALILALSVIAGACYQYWMNDAIGSVSSQVGLGIVASIAYALIAWHMGVYRTSALLQQRRDYGQMLLAWLLVVFLLILLLFLLKLSAQISRGAVICFVVATPIVLVVWRKAVKQMVRGALERGIVTGRRIILIGTRNELAPLRAKHLLEAFGLHETARAILPQHDAGDPVISHLEIEALAVAIERSRSADAQEIVLTLPWGDANYLEFVRDRLRVSPLPVRLLPDRYVRSIWAGYGPGGAGQMLIDIQRAPLSRAELAIKRGFDVTLASMLLVLLFPLLVATAIAIRLDSRGPAIFRQRRRGFNGRDFIIHKFRTMRVMEDGDVIQQASRGDTRVTRLGRLLRRSSIDELPQLLNVLQGDMSLVGPRPHAIAHDKEYGALLGNYAFRHHVKPGITGWAQVNGFRGETAHVDQMRKRIEFDVWYVNNWSVWLDFQILMRTCVEVGRTTKAY